MTGWKTITVAILQLLAYVLAWEQLVEYLDPQVIAIAATVIMGILRFFTGTSIFKA